MIDNRFSICGGMYFSFFSYSLHTMMTIPAFLCEHFFLCPLSLRYITTFCEVWLTEYFCICIFVYLDNDTGYFVCVLLSQICLR